MLCSRRRRVFDVCFWDSRGHHRERNRGHNACGIRPWDNHFVAKTDVEDTIAFLAMREPTHARMAREEESGETKVNGGEKTQLRGIVRQLDSGGGEVEFEEFASAWKMMAGDREESATIARKAFKVIDADGNGTMDFEEFFEIDARFEEGTEAMMSAANDPTCGSDVNGSARSLRDEEVGG